MSDDKYKKNIRENFKIAFRKWEKLINESPQPVNMSNLPDYDGAMAEATARGHNRLEAFNNMKETFDYMVKKHGPG